ncbi:MAG: FISUMP domain-containing protein, partial [Bacteroidales bacterium]|nr:FISUMP domain-containing protein [Bacteroidales bacterium]
FGSGTIDLSQNTPASGVSYVIDGMSNTSNSVTVSLGTAITPTTDYSTTPKVYMVVLPGMYVGDLKIGVESAGVFKEIKKTDATFERGKKYIVKVDADMASIPVITGSELVPVTIDGTTWMPVNAGYRQDLTMGEYFQWFRKYGFGQQPEIMLANETLWNDDLDQETSMEKYKNVFFKSKGSGFDWMPCYQAAWNLTEKFNPCPAGWRLPTKTEVITLISYGSTSIITDNAGGVDGLRGRWVGPNHDNPDLRTTTAVFFPYTGMMSYSSGLWPSSFSVGYYWLAYYGEPSTTYNGQMMSVNQNQSTNPSTSLMNKANALSVRCVKREASVESLLYTTKPVDVQEGLVISGGYIEEEGSLPVTERGVFYGNSINPATTKVVASTAGAGSFMVDIKDLEEFKTYYVRAYAKNSAGTVYYGDQYKFIKKSSANYNGEEVTINGVTWAPYNAGYSDSYPYGLLYQWHRKYGQTYHSETPTPSFASGPTTLVNISSYTNRNRFYFNTNSPNDCVSPQQTSWKMDRMYNPCPEGWRVPTSAEFQSLLNSGSSVGIGPGGIQGIWFGENSSTIDHIDCIFLPFSGYRDYTSTPASRGVEAVYWTSEVSSTHAKMLYINNSTSILSVSARANGMSVRCVKE